MRLVLRLLAALLVGAALAAATLVATAWRVPSCQIPPDAVPNAATVTDPEGALERFRRTLAIPTVSSAEGSTDAAALIGLRRELEASYPQTHAVLRREVVAGHSLLYRWSGSDPDLAPALLLGHLDVVPADASEWTHDPFSSVVADGYLWGRGTLDDKINVVGLLEAVEQRLSEGFRPRRTLWLAFGHDEEIGGTGAVAMAARLDALGVRPALVLDEGLAVVDGQIPGLDRPAAMIGIAEKTAVTVELVAEGPGGHGSMPPEEPATVLLGRALARLGDADLPVHLDGPAGDLLEALAPEVGLPLRTVFHHRDLLEPILAAELGASPAGRALLRTSVAPTMLSGSPKVNVLPTVARARIDVRLHPGDSVDLVLARLATAIDDPRVRVVGPTDLEPGFRPPVSPAAGEGWDALHAAVARTFPEAVVAPSLVLGATDARHYTGLSEHVYRFTPMSLGPEDLERVHGIDERISVDGWTRAVAFYLALVDALSG